LCKYHNLLYDGFIAFKEFIFNIGTILLPALE